MSKKILVLTAIDDELDKARAPEGVEVIYTGVGKVNAASAATLALLVLRPSLVINYGTAGKINETLRGLVEVSHVIQRDMMADAAGAARQARRTRPDHRSASSSGHDGIVTCGTGDSFVTSVDPWLNENNIDIVDMELFAIAYVCERHSLPWRSFKFITDDADDNAADHWTGKYRRWPRTVLGCDEEADSLTPSSATTGDRSTAGLVVHLSQDTARPAARRVRRPGGLRASSAAFEIARRSSGRARPTPVTRPSNEPGYAGTARADVTMLMASPSLRSHRAGRAFSQRRFRLTFGVAKRREVVLADQPLWPRHASQPASSVRATRHGISDIDAPDWRGD